MASQVVSRNRKENTNAQPSNWWLVTNVVVGMSEFWNEVLPPQKHTVGI